MHDPSWKSLKEKSSESWREETLAPLVIERLKENGFGDLVNQNVEHKGFVVGMDKVISYFLKYGKVYVEWSKGEYADYPEEEKKQPYIYARDLHRKGKTKILEYARASGVFHESYKLDYRNGEVPVILIMLAKLPWMEIDHLLDNTAQTVVEQYPIPEKNKVKEFKALVEEHVEKVVIDQEKIVEETLEQWCQIPAIRAHIMLLAERLKGQNSS